MNNSHLRFTRRGLGAVAASAIALLAFAVPQATRAEDKTIKVGIMSGEDAWQMIRAGASLVQVYTGFVYGGPGFVRSIHRHLLRRLTESGRRSIDEVVGEALLFPRLG